MSAVSGSNLRMGLIDQALYSGTNVLLAVLVAHSVDAENFGAFSLAYILFILVVGSCRSFSGGALLIRFGGRSQDAVRLAGARAISAAALIGLGLGAACVLAGVAAGGIHMGPLLWLGVTLPFLLGQDAIRSTFFAMERPGRAALNDGVWAGLQLLAIAYVLLTFEDPSATPFVAAWCLAGTAAGLFGLVQLRLAPSMIRLDGWFGEISDLGTPLLFEYLLAAGPGHLLYLLTPVVAGTAALGIIRGAYVFFGPLNVLHEASNMLFVPTARRAGSLTAIKRIATRVAVVMAAIAAVWTLIIGLLPDVLGELAIDEIWSDTSVVVWILGVSLIAEALIAGIGIGLRTVERPVELVRARAAAGPFIVVIGLTAGAAWGAPGLAIGLAVGYTLTAVLAWLALHRVREDQIPAALIEFETTKAGDSP
jgi:hypothetical protein